MEPTGGSRQKGKAKASTTETEGVTKIQSGEESGADEGTKVRASPGSRNVYCRLTTVQPKRKKRAKVKKEDTAARDAHAATIAVDQLDKLLESATLGFTKMNVLEPPHPTMSFNYGSVNNRGIDEASVTRLVEAFQASGKQGGKPGCELYVLVEPDWVEEGSFTKDGTVAFQSLPVVKFTAAALGKVLEFMNGHHRGVASKRLIEKMLEKIAKNESLVSDLTTDDNGKKTKTSEEDQVLITTAEANIADARNVIADAPWWKIRLVIASEYACERDAGRTSTDGYWCCR